MVYFLIFLPLLLESAQQQGCLLALPHQVGMMLGRQRTLRRPTVTLRIAPEEHDFI